jgi:hypothetical protein
MKKGVVKNAIIDTQEKIDSVSQETWEKIKETYDCELYVIFDRISHKYSSPLPFQNKQLAIRYFDSLLANCDNVRTKASDYELYHVGFYDTETASLLVVSKLYVKSGEEIMEVDNGKGKK